MKVFASLLISMVAVHGAHASQDSMSLPAITTTSASTTETVRDIAARSREQALLTESVYYSLPRENMSSFEMGGYSLRTNERRNGNFIFPDESSQRGQGLYFKHSRGVLEKVALDFDLNYAWPDQSASNQYSGINHLSLGGRSLFQGLGLNWVYGGALTYLPNGEINDRDSKTTVSAKIGFEERVDIARWGLETQVSSQNTLFADEQLNLVGFFEIPFITTLKMGASAGADVRSLGTDKQSNFARIYGRYSMDKVSDAQLAVQQTNQQSNILKQSDAEVSLSMSRVF